MPQNYTPEFKKKIVRLHEEEGRTYKSITAEYGVSKASMPVIGIEIINLLHQLGFNGVILTELFFIICYFLVYGSRINFHIDFFLHHCCKLRIADQFHYYLGYSIVQKFFPYLLFIITFVSPLHTTVFTSIIEKVLILCAVLFVFNALIPIQ